MQIQRFLPFALLLALPLAGCQTVEVVRGVEYEVSDEPKQDERENALIETLEENPEDIGAWYALAGHYEQGLRYADAYMAYGNFHGLIDREEKKRKVPMSKRTTEGLNCLARIAKKLQRPQAVFEHSTAVLKRQPKSLHVAKHNPHYRVAHLRVARYHFNREEEEKAFLHAMIHKELGGKKSDGILIKLEERKERRAKEKKIVRPSHDSGKEKAQPAGSRK